MRDAPLEVPLRTTAVLLMMGLCGCGNNHGASSDGTSVAQDSNRGGGANDKTAAKDIEGGWAYEEELDPVTKLKSAKARGDLAIPSVPGVLAEVTIDCKTPTVEDTEAQIALFHKPRVGMDYVPLDLTREGPINLLQYRFDGIVSTAVLTRTYVNATTISFGNIDPIIRDENKGKIHATYKREYASHTFGGRREHIDHIVKLILDDTDFATKFETPVGIIPIEFSLSTPEIKKVLIECGFEYQ